MATGKGRSLGDALVDLFSQQGRPGGRRASYDRQGWRAQFAQLSSTTSGYAAMERAGLSATTRTQRGWLSGDAAASAANQKLISQAYQAMAGGWSPSWETREFKISGRVTAGNNDSRVRGFGRSAPLRVDGSGANWVHIEREFNGDANPASIEQLFIQYVIVPDIGETSGGTSGTWEFDGDRYEVSE